MIDGGEGEVRKSLEVMMAGRSSGVMEISTYGSRRGKWGCLFFSHSYHSVQKCVAVEANSYNTVGLIVVVLADIIIHVLTNSQD